MRGILKISGYFLISVDLCFIALPFFQSAFPISPAAAETASPAGKETMIENIVISEPSLTFKIKSLRVFGGSLPDSDLAILFDSKSAQPLSERLRQLTADTILISEISIEKTGELKELVTYHDVKLEQVAGGIAAKASAAEANFTFSGAQNHTRSGAYGQMRAEVFDMSLAAAMMTQVRTAADVQKTLLYKAFAVDGFTFADPKDGFALSLKEMSGHKVTARPLRQPVSGPADQTEAREENPFSDYVSMVWDGFDVGDAQTSGLHTTVLSEDKSITLVLDELQINDLKEGRIARAGLTGLDLQSEKTNIKLKDLAIGGIDLRALGSLADEQSPLEGEKNARPPKLFSAADSVQLNGLEAVILPSSSAPGEGAAEPPRDTGRGAKGLTAGGFTLERAELNHFPMQDSGPGTFASFSHLVVNLNPNLGQDGSGNALANLGYSKADLSGSVAFSVNPAKELNISDLTVSGTNLGALKASLIAEDVTGDVLSPDPAIAEAAFHQAVLKHIDVRIDNFGLLDKVISHQAEVQNKTINETRDSYVSTARLIVPVLLGGGPSAKEIGNAVANFIADPKTLQITADAPTGLSLADLNLLQDPAALMSKLKLKVKSGP